MTVPTYDKFIEPILRYLASCPDGARAREVYEAAANALKISEETRQDILPSGFQPVYKNRAGWGNNRLKASFENVAFIYMLDPFRRNHRA